jgi:hypothetical protein
LNRLIPTALSHHAGNILTFPFFITPPPPFKKSYDLSPIKQPELHHSLQPASQKPTFCGHMHLKRSREEKAKRSQPSIRYQQHNPSAHVSAMPTLCSRYGTAMAPL